jgi:ABC-type glycerol-3-phosphate transport system substrate-binding protein
MKLRYLPLSLTLIIALCACSAEPALPTRESETPPEATEKAVLPETPSPSPEPAEKTTVTLMARDIGDIWRSSLDDRLRIYRRENPEVDVRVNYYPRGYGSEYALAVAADLASGVAADLIEMNSIPTRKYGRLGYFEDLYPYMDNDAELTQDRFYPNILKAMETDGKLFRLVTSAEVFAYNLQSQYAHLVDPQLTDRYTVTWEEMAAIYGSVKAALPSEDVLLYPA